ncbi:MAG: HAD-IIA family hydrolase [Clostridia bacterium]
MNDLKSKELLVLDMDGTFYLENTLIDGARELLEEIGRKGKRFLFFTNNSSKAMDDYIQKLSDLGVQANRDSLFSSGDVTIGYLKRHCPGQKIYLIGTRMLKRGFEKEGIILTEEDPDGVVLGFDTELTYEKIYKGCTFIRNGAFFIATHPDVNCPVKNGLMPDCGSMIKMFTESTGKVPLVMGKPSRHTVEAIEEKTGVGRDKMVFVGDRLETDIAIGTDNGAMSVLVLTGATDRALLDRSSIRPDLVRDSVKDLIPLL